MENTSKTDGTQQPKNENIAAFLQKLKDNKFRLIIYAPALIAYICWVIAIFLPVANIMRLHPEVVSIFDLQEYNINSIPLLLCALLLQCGALATILSELLLKRGKANGAVALSIVFGIISFVGLCLFAAVSASICFDLETLSEVRTDSGAGETCMIISGIISSLYGIFGGVFIGFIKSGKIKIKGEITPSNSQSNIDRQ